MLSQAERSAWRGSAQLALALTLVAYTAALCLARSSVPAGISNDVAEEALRGISLVESGRLEVINLYGVDPTGQHFGRSAETLFLYLLGLAGKVVGPSLLAINLATWPFALLTIALLAALARSIVPTLPIGVPLALGASSIWLFHYARSGLRASTAPFFLLAVVLLLRRESLKDGKIRAGPPLAAGLALGLSLYAYTSCRVLVLAYGLFVGIRLVVERSARRAVVHHALWVLTGLIVASVPNIVFFLSHPEEFLYRGTYVLLGDRSPTLTHLRDSLLLPFHYPRYTSVADATHHFDGVSVGLTVAGILPLNPLVGLAALAGAIRAWPLRRDPAIAYLLSVFVTAICALGIAGPSLTRFLLILPVYLIFAAIGFGAIWSYPRARAPVAFILAALIGVSTFQYFVVYAGCRESKSFASKPATQIGTRALEVARSGRRVLCVVAADSSVIYYLTHDARDAVSVHGFWHREARLTEVPLFAIKPSTILVQDDPAFDSFRSAFRLFADEVRGPGYHEYTVSPEWRWPDSP